VGLYYYLMSQLPSLMYDQKPPMPSAAFKELAASLLNKKDAALLKYLSLQLDTNNPDLNNNDNNNGNYIDNSSNIENKKFNKTGLTGCEFIDNWREWEKTLRLNLARYRYLELINEKNPNDFKKAPKAETAADEGDTYYFEDLETLTVPVIPADAYNAASVIFTQDGSPLDGEIMIDKARWNAIDLMLGNEYFDRNNVYAYYLKLLILERRQLFEVEKGFSEYKSLYSQIINSSSNKSGSGDKNDQGFYQERQ